MERAVAAELANTATVITHTGMFDTIDRLYKSVSGSTEAPPAEGGEPGGGMMGSPPMGGGSPPPPPPPEPPGGGAEGLPEGTNKLENLLLENIDDELYITNSSLGQMERELMKILKD
jgi:hypothetical protein